METVAIVPGRDELPGSANVVCEPLVSEDWIQGVWKTQVLVGGGHFAHVHTAIRKDDGVTCALKRVNRRQFEAFRCRKESSLDCESEGRWMQRLQHAGVVSCWEWYRTEEAVYIAME